MLRFCSPVILCDAVVALIHKYERVRDDDLTDENIKT